MHATVFQYNILPFLVGVSLLVYGSLWLLLMLPVCWVLAVPFSSFFLFILPLVVGWELGCTIFTNLYPGSAAWYWGGGALGAAAMFIVCSVVVAIVTVPPGGMHPPIDGGASYSFFDREIDENEEAEE